MGCAVEEAVTEALAMGHGSGGLPDCLLVCKKHSLGSGPCPGLGGDEGGGEDEGGDDCGDEGGGGAEANDNTSAIDEDHDDHQHQQYQHQHKQQQQDQWYTPPVAPNEVQTQLPHPEILGPEQEQARMCGGGGLGGHGHGHSDEGLEGAVALANAGDEEAVGDDRGKHNLYEDLTDQLLNAGTSSSSSSSTSSSSSSNSDDDDDREAE